MLYRCLSCRLGIERAIIVGHSLGSAFANYALSRDRARPLPRFCGAVLLDPIAALLHHATTIREFVYRPVSGLTDDVTDFFFKKARHTPHVHVEWSFLCMCMSDIHRMCMCMYTAPALRLLYICTTPALTCTHEAEAEAEVEAEAEAEAEGEAKGLDQGACTCCSVWGLRTHCTCTCIAYALRG